MARLGLKVCVKEVRFAPVRAAEDPGKPPENTRRASVKRTRLDCDQFKSADGGITKSPQICENKGLIFGADFQFEAQESHNGCRVSEPFGEVCGGRRGTNVTIWRSTFSRGTLFGRKAVLLIERSSGRAQFHPNAAEFQGV